MKRATFSLLILFLLLPVSGYAEKAYPRYFYTFEDAFKELRQSFTEGSFEQGIALAQERSKTVGRSKYFPLQIDVLMGGQLEYAQFKAVLLMRQGRPDEALKVFEKSLKSFNSWMTTLPKGGEACLRAHLLLYGAGLPKLTNEERLKLLAQADANIQAFRQASGAPSLEARSLQFRVAHERSLLLGSTRTHSQASTEEKSQIISECLEELEFGSVEMGLPSIFRLINELDGLEPRLAAYRELTRATPELQFKAMLFAALQDDHRRNHDHNSAYFSTADPEPLASCLSYYQEHSLALPPLLRLTKLMLAHSLFLQASKPLSAPDRRRKLLEVVALSRDCQAASALRSEGAFETYFDALMELSKDVETPERESYRAEGLALLPQIRAFLRVERSSQSLHDDLKPLLEVPAGKSPEYSLALRKARITGSVTIGFIVGTDLRIKFPYVVRSTHPALEASALDFINKLRVKRVAFWDNKPVNVSMEEEVRYDDAQ